MKTNRREFLELGGLAFLGMAGLGKIEGGGKGMFIHAVNFKFKPDVSEEEIAGLMQELANIKNKIPVLKEYLVGKNTSQGGQGYVYGLVSVFEKKEDLPEYENHPEHKRVAGKIIPLVAGVIAMDFEPL